MLFSLGGASTRSLELPTAQEALPDRQEAAVFNPIHFVSGHRIAQPLPDHLSSAVFGLGCFWGAERLFWQLEGVYSTAVGYAGGITANPSYEDVCSGRTGHAEVVIVFFDPALISYQQLLSAFGRRMIQHRGCARVTMLERSTDRHFTRLTPSSRSRRSNE